MVAQLRLDRDGEKFSRRGTHDSMKPHDRRFVARQVEISHKASWSFSRCDRTLCPPLRDPVNLSCASKDPLSLVRC